MFVYDAFEPGKDYGVWPFVFDGAALASWCDVFAEDAGEIMPPGMTAMVAMQAYMHVIAPRPPGNIHARQQVEIRRLPRLGEQLSTAVRCLGKEVRRGRHRVQLELETCDQAGEPVFITTMLSLVAQ